MEIGRCEPQGGKQKSFLLQLNAPIISLLASGLCTKAVKDHRIPTQETLLTSGKGVSGVGGLPSERGFCQLSLLPPTVLYRVDALMGLEKGKARPEGNDGWVCAILPGGREWMM